MKWPWSKTRVPGIRVAHLAITSVRDVEFWSKEIIANPGEYHFEPLMLMRMIHKLAQEAHR